MLRRRLLRFKRRRQRLSYQVRPKEDGRNKTAQAVDLLFLVGFVWLAALMLLAKIYSISLALPASVFLAAAAGAAASHYQRRKRELRRQRYRLWLAGQRCREEIKKIKTREELAVFVSLLFAQLPQFTDLQVHQKGGQKALRLDEAVAISAKYRGVPVGVQCLPPAAGQQEEIKLLQSFQRALQERGLKSALVVVPGAVRADVRRLIAGLRKKYRVVVLNEERLVELALQAGRQPAAEDRQEGVAGHSRPEPVHKLVLEQKKGLRYLLAAGVLWFIYLVSPPAGLWGGFYPVLMAVNIALGAACFIFHWKDEDAFGLEDLEP